jgi:hypothetical protein
MLEKVLKLERLLMDWRRELPPMLRLRPWDASFSESAQNLIFDRLSIIIALRYLNARVLLHRQVLTRFLEQINNRNSDLEEDVFLHQFGQSSLQVCIDSALEIISIIHKVGKRPYLLGAWWFSTYYSKIPYANTETVETDLQSFQCCSSRIRWSSYQCQ